jgi:hypothetical protein
MTTKALSEIEQLFLEEQKNLQPVWAYIHLRDPHDPDSEFVLEFAKESHLQEMAKSLKRKEDSIGFDPMDDDVSILGLDFFQSLLNHWVGPVTLPEVQQYAHTLMWYEHRRVLINLPEGGQCELTPYQKVKGVGKVTTYIVSLVEK